MAYKKWTIIHSVIRLPMMTFSIHHLTCVYGSQMLQCGRAKWYFTTTSASQIPTGACQQATNATARTQPLDPLFLSLQEFSQEFIPALNNATMFLADPDVQNNTNTSQIATDLINSLRSISVLETLVTSSEAQGSRIINQTSSLSQPKKFLGLLLMQYGVWPDIHLRQPQMAHEGFMTGPQTSKHH